MAAGESRYRHRYIHEEDAKLPVLFDDSALCAIRKPINGIHAALVPNRHFLNLNAEVSDREFNRCH